MRSVLLPAALVLQSSAGWAGSLETSAGEVVVAGPSRSAFQGAYAYGGAALGSSALGLDSDGGIDGEDAGLPGSLDFALDLPDLGAEGVGLSLGLGYDAEVAPRTVLGGFLDYTRPELRTDASADVTLSSPLFGEGDLDAHAVITQEAALTVAARVGYVVTPGTLVYGLAGVTRGEWEASYGYSLPDGALGEGAGSRGYEADGVTLGGGIEVFVRDNLSLRMEYRRTDFETIEVMDSDLGGAGFLRTEAEATSQSVNLLGAFRF